MNPGQITIPLADHTGHLQHCWPWETMGQCRYSLDHRVVPVIGVHKWGRLIYWCHWHRASRCGWCLSVLIYECVRWPQNNNLQRHGAKLQCNRMWNGTYALLDESQCSQTPDGLLPQSSTAGAMPIEKLSSNAGLSIQKWYWVYNYSHIS